jgi:hypothetical protein
VRTKPSDKRLVMSRRDRGRAQSADGGQLQREPAECSRSSGDQQPFAGPQIEPVQGLPRGGELIDLGADLVDHSGQIPTDADLPRGTIRPCSASQPARVAMSTGFTAAAWTRIRT